MQLDISLAPCMESPQLAMERYEPQLFKTAVMLSSVVQAESLVTAVYMQQDT